MLSKFCKVPEVFQSFQSFQNPQNPIFQNSQSPDFYLPSWDCGRPAAVDLAVTSGLQCGLLESSATDGGDAAARYEAIKCEDMQTKSQCDEVGIAFTPFVVEAEGGLGHTGRKLLRRIAADAARLTGKPASWRAEMVSQSLSIVLQRANAQAVLRRAGAVLACGAPRSCS